MRALAIDIGGSHATCALVSDRSILAKKTISYSNNEKLIEILPKIAEAFEVLVAEQNLGFQDFSGIAVGFCGLVDTKNRKVLSTKGRFADAHEINLRSWALEIFGLELFIDNDARLALLGEWYAGSGAGSNDLVMMTLGTGVGGAAMIEGRLLRGKHFQAGCLGGHLPIQTDGRVCPCGNIGCVEAQASTAVLPEICKTWPNVEASPVSDLIGTHFGFREIIELKSKGDVIAGEIFNSCVKAWAAGSVAMIHAYDPEHVIIGGGVIEGAPDEIIFKIQEHVNKHAWTPWGNVSVRAAKLGNSAALLGAIPLIQGAQA
jgi:glucokinase